MKKVLFALAISALSTAAVAQPKNINLLPGSGLICENMEVVIDIKGAAFNPVSYLWNTGATTASIYVTASGNYTVTISGYFGNSPNMATFVKKATYAVLPKPQVNAYSNLWVCKGDTVELGVDSGYDTYTWSNGQTGVLFSQAMNNPGTPGFPALDTMSVSYTATIDGVCSASSDPVLLRTIRKPDGVGKFYQGKMDIHPSDSIPAGYVLEYLHPVTYDMYFLDVADPSKSVSYTTAAGSRKAPASILQPGRVYEVTTTPVINGQTFCSGAPSTIEVAASGNRIAFGFTPEEGIKTFAIYDMNGKKIMEQQAAQFNKEWLSEIAPQMIIVHKSGINGTEVVKMQVTR